jgi:hypothetical protein
MSTDIVSSAAPDDKAMQICATWQTAHRRRDDVERSSLVASIASALDGPPIAALEVAAAAAAFGATWGSSARTLNGLVEDLDLLEEIWLDDDPSHVRELHSLVTTARRSAIAAFAHASAFATKKRLRLARHDILNAIGAMRNAVLLMDDQTLEANRANIQGIAKRNALAAETLVRLHLSDGAGLSSEFGWKEIAGSELSDTVEATVGQMRGVANVGALDALVRSVCDTYRRGDPPESERITMSVGTTSPGVGRLTLCASSSADRIEDPRIVDVVRQLSDTLGVTLEEGSSPAQLRFVFPLLAGDERHDLGGAGQGYHTNSVRL